MADENARELARTCREALSQQLYGGDAPHDSNALSEVWPTRTGAAFTLEHEGREYAVIVTTAGRVTDLTMPDYGTD